MVRMSEKKDRYVHNQGSSIDPHALSLNKTHLDARLQLVVDARERHGVGRLAHLAHRRRLAAAVHRQALQLRLHVHHAEAAGSRGRVRLAMRAPRVLPAQLTH